MDPVRLQAAIDFANAHETSMPRDPGLYLRDRFEGQPHQEIVGPTRERGGVNGIVLKGGYIVAEWGETHRPDMTFSVTKSYLSTVAGLAHDRGLIPDLDARVVDFVPDATFTSAQNRDITWRHLLTQTSEWEGTLWGKPDQADRRRGVDRTLNPPGTFWEYNDVRVNLLAYALVHVWRRPLPRVLKDEVMDPIGASTTWRWHGYETSWTVVDGLRVQSVSGGGHWGGGFIISTRDHARFGLLLLRRGAWGDRRILSEAWVAQASSPSAVQPNYGFMWWLNGAECGMSTAVGCTEGAARIFPAAPATSFFALGAGSTNVIFVDPEHDIVTVTRWIDGGEYVNGFLERVLAAVNE
jgi:CubicO group peptidase (beta-lactamase class C family)